MLRTSWVCALALCCWGCDDDGSDAPLELLDMGGAGDSAAPESDARVEPEADTGEPVTDSGVEPELDMAIEPAGDSGVDPEPDMGPDPEPDMGPDPEPDMGPDPEPDMGPDPEPDMGPDPEPDVGADPEPDLGADPEPDMGPPDEPMDLEVEGEVSGEWCGAITLLDSVTVPAGEVLELCPGTTVRNGTPDRGVAINVVGVLRVRGDAEAPVRIGMDAAWRGLRVSGEVDAEHLELSAGASCVDGLDEAVVSLRHTRVENCQSTISVRNGVTLDRSTIIGGSSLQVRGGIFRMVDSVIDFGHPQRAPDCVVFNGGGLDIEYSRVTGCHCPLHVNRAPEGMNVSHSVLDDAAYAIMIAGTEATLNHNHFIGASDDLLDIGGGIDADIADNWYGDDGLQLATGDRDQFPGADRAAEGPFDDVGPRP